MIDHVRIVVVGDQGVGKTALVKTLLTENFEEPLEPVLPTVVVPPEVTPEHVHVSIIDTPSGAADAATLEEELRNANVVVLVYDVSRRETLERVSPVWLRKLHEMEISVPVVLAGNKIDLRTADFEERTLEALIKPIMEEHRELEVCIECSAKQIFNVAEVFYFAQKSVLHPTAPLYDVSTHALRPKTVAALTRVFRLCDKDGDGLLNDKELNDFQYQCFNVMLRDEELAGVKNVVREGCADGIAKTGEITLEGFIFLHTLFIQKGRLETTWTVLRKFGYDESMTLSRDSIAGGCGVLESKQADQVVELSEAGVAFLGKLFDVFDSDHDGHLSKQDVAKMFLPHPEDPWAEEQGFLVEASSKGDDFLAREGFMNRWRLWLFKEPEAALLAMEYLGFSEEIGTAFVLSKSRRRERRAVAAQRRKTFSVSVLGGSQSGKTELIRGMLGLPFGKAVLDKSHVVRAAAQVPVEAAFGGGTRTLILSSVPEDQTSEFVSSKSLLEQCDVACLVYDASVESTFSDTLRLYEILSTARPTLPIIFVASKGDLPAANQLTPEGASPEQVCAQRGIPEPQGVSMKSGENANIYEMLVGVAMNPQVACPAYEAEAAVALDSYLIPALKVTAGIVAVGLAAFGTKKIYDKVKASSSAATGTRQEYERGRAPTVSRDRGRGFATNAYKERCDESAQEPTQIATTSHTQSLCERSRNELISYRQRLEGGITACPRT
ncbi:Mitochondrial Rho GTPase 1 [Porphyridium purpureum]|uniref:Mitochondrial Rho GTPase 1 n=1 Tax=Porphyridium purpureum TaxID=35688 RepID=A0A5J4YMH2_PORPP|nr:Mitochondrial Rho GTPase 1 [Porphyridium purpureum]|eukprot:POR6473..scf295_9